METLVSLEELNTIECRKLKRIHGLGPLTKLKELSFFACYELEELASNIQPAAESLRLCRPDARATPWYPRPSMHHLAAHPCYSLFRLPLHPPVVHSTRRHDTTLWTVNGISIHLMNGVNVPPRSFLNSKLFGYFK